jgi:hypothetical protein
VLDTDWDEVGEDLDTSALLFSQSTRSKKASDFDDDF